MKSHFVTEKRSVAPRRHGRNEDIQNFRDGSWFRRMVPVQPGTFVLPAPETPVVYDPLPPEGLVKERQPLDPRHYYGRVHEVSRKTLALTLWEIPNGRELYASVMRRGSGTTIKRDARLAPGTPVELWTWTEIPRPKHSLDRVHLQPMTGAQQKARGSRRSRP